MKISKDLFREIFDEAKRYSIEEYDGSNSHALCNILEVVERYREKYPNIDKEVENLIVERIFNPPHEAFPE
ncbi:hypothetical protein ACJJI4_01215 [Microbulbifer sp. TRSA002]|uniref:hypothetical protein n=1 Tax=Microbulbifer sp. TRSA002 TaxID=3243382 RepID=UPI00403A7479